MTSSGKSAAAVGLVRVSCVGETFLSSDEYLMEWMTGASPFPRRVSSRGLSGKPSLVGETHVPTVAHNQMIQHLNPKERTG